MPNNDPATTVVDSDASVPALSGRRTLVTGGTSGLGFGIASALIAAGAAVVIAGRDTRRGWTAAEELGCEFVQVDVALREDCRTLIAATIERLGGLDVLVNNAGVFIAGATHEFPESHWNQVVNTKFKGTFFCTAAALPHMIAQRWGRVVNVSAGLGSHAAAYVGANAAVAALTRALVLEYGHLGITFNEVSPGFIDTPATEPIRRDTRQLQEIIARIPAGRIGQPRDIAPAVVYLASDSAAYIQGASLRIDGGAQ